MNKIDALIIRAIKSRSPDFRLKRIYQKFYCSEYRPFHLCKILANIIDEYKIMSSRDWIDCMNPENAWKYKDTDDYHEKLNDIFQSKIWCTPISYFGKDFPRMSKNK